MYVFEYVNDQNFQIRREEHIEAVSKQPMYTGKCSIWYIAELAGEQYFFINVKNHNKNNTAIISALEANITAAFHEIPAEMPERVYQNWHSFSFH